MPRGGKKERRSRSPSEVKRTQKKEKQAQKEKDARMFEIERKRAEAGKRGAMRAFTASQPDSDSMSDKVAMEAEDEHDLGAAAPAEKGNDKYLETQKKKREKAKAHAKDREEKRKRSEEK